VNLHDLVALQMLMKKLQEDSKLHANATDVESEAEDTDLYHHFKMGLVDNGGDDCSDESVNLRDANEPKVTLNCKYNL